MLFRSRRREPPTMTLEGVLGPNARLYEAEGMAVDAPAALCVAGDGRLLFSAGTSVFALGEWGDDPVLWSTFDEPVTALCASPGGLVGIGMTGGGLAVRDGQGGKSGAWSSPAGLESITDCMFLSEDEIAIVHNGYGDGEDVLSLSPWDEAARGGVVAVSGSGGSKEIVGDLHCPMGISREDNGKLMVSLLERASIVDQSGAIRQSGLPAYLGRIRRTQTGYLISCLARRDPLIEFLKTETTFVAEMKRKIAPRHWLSPRINPEFSHEFPIELGATRLFGEIKPWAPSFSYGLIIEIDENFIPVASAHSRANGTRHAISDAAIWNGHIVAVSMASGELLRLSRSESA